MSGDELLVLLISGAAALYGWGLWYLALLEVWPVRGKQNRLWLGFLPIVSVLATIVVLRTLASFDVVTDGIYIFFYIIMGLAWLVGARELMFLFFDLSWRDDIVERNNTAAMYAMAGGLFGITAIYAGANIGDGPGWWTVVFAGGLGTLTWFLLLLLINKFGNSFERITIGRDMSTAIRIGFFMLASGLVLGRGSGGDWTSASHTIVEFIDAWPVLILTAMAVLVESSSSRSETSISSSSQVSIAFMWGIVYLLLAIAAVMLLPPLPENPLYDWVRDSMW